MLQYLQAHCVSNPQILAVDGDPRSRGLVHECLRTQGYRVTPLHGGEGMRRVLDQKRIDLVVLDVADRSIHVRVSGLRDKARGPIVIKTRHGRGYMIAISVSKREVAHRASFLRADRCSAKPRLQAPPAFPGAKIYQREYRVATKIIISSSRSGGHLRLRGAQSVLRSGTE